MLFYRSCLGVRCFNQPVTQNGQDLIRVGFLYFPNSGAELLFELLNPFFINGKNAQIEVVPDTHVPAYGYGKNHGWSSIVRVARRPIHHAYSLVQNAHLETSPESMECQVCQIICVLRLRSMSRYYEIAVAASGYMAMPSQSRSCAHSNADRCVWSCAERELYSFNVASNCLLQ